MTDKIQSQQRILTMQRDLMTAILDYQIANGAGSINWNVNVVFVEGKQSTGE